MAKKEFEEIHSKIDKILELSSKTDVRLAVLETKVSTITESVGTQKKDMIEFISETKCQRKECAAKFDDIDKTFSKGQGAIWMIGFTGVIIGVLGAVWAFVSGIFKG